MSFSSFAVLQNDESIELLLEKINLLKKEIEFLTASIETNNLSISRLEEANQQLQREMQDLRQGNAPIVQAQAEGEPGPSQPSVVSSAPPYPPVSSSATPQVQGGLAGCGGDGIWKRGGGSGCVPKGSHQIRRQIKVFS